LLRKRHANKLSQNIETKSQKENQPRSNGLQTPSQFINAASLLSMFSSGVRIKQDNKSGLGWLDAGEFLSGLLELTLGLLL
jgi:hypothetical protein